MTLAITLNHCPAPFKEAFIHSIPKEQVGEFRPIALLFHLGKVLDLLIPWKLRPFLVPTN